jgi:hypothetical protein
MKGNINSRLIVTTLVLVILAGTFEATFKVAFAEPDPLSEVWSMITTTSPSADCLWHNLGSSTPLRALNETGGYTTYIGPDGKTWYKQIGKITAMMIVIDFPDAKAADNTGINAYPGEEPYDIGNRVHGHILKTAQDYYDYLMPRASEWFYISSYGQLNFDVTLVKNPDAEDGVFTARGLLWDVNEYNIGGKPYAFVRGGDVTSYLRDVLAVAKPVVQYYPGTYNVLYVVAVENACGITYGPTDMSGSTANTYTGRTDFKGLVRIGFDSYERWRHKGVNHETGHLLGLNDFYMNAFSGYGGGQCDPFVGPEARRPWADYYPYCGHWDLMGYINGHAPDIFAWMKWRLGWIGDDQVGIINSAGTTTYQLTPVETPGGTKLVFVPGSTKGIVFCIEYRQLAGVDDTATRELSTDPDPEFPNTNWRHLYGTLNSTGILMYKIDCNVGGTNSPLTVINLYPDDTSMQLGSRLDSSVLGASSGIYSYTDPAAGITVTLVEETEEVATVTVDYNPPTPRIKPVLYDARFIDYKTIEFKTSLDLRGIQKASIVVRRSTGATVSGVTINQITSRTIRITFSTTTFTTAEATVGTTISTSAFSFFAASDPAPVTPLKAPILSEAKFKSLTQIQVKSDIDMRGLPAANIQIKKADGTTVPTAKITRVTFDSENMLLTVEFTADQFPTQASTVGTKIATVGVYSDYVANHLNLTMARWNPPVICVMPSTLVPVADGMPPLLIVERPLEGEVLQDGVTLQVSAYDISGVSSVTFSIREPNGEQGTIIDPMFESMPATLSPDGKWRLYFDTTQLPDGYYILIVNGTDTLGNSGIAIVNFKIRNWACPELLPATPESKAGRTMPIKFSLRIDASVDPDQPFVVNEELTIIIYEKDHPEAILQTSTYGTTATDYRISDIDELYITNFKTLKTPTTYVVEIYRKGMLIGSFEFQTVK